MYWKPLLIPLLLQVMLSFVVMLVMYRQRVMEMQSARITPQRVRTRALAGQELKASAQSADNYANLFELPVLFYTGVLLTLILMIQDNLLVALAWLFVVARCAHSLIHVTYNRVMHRFWAFVFSSLVLLAYWTRLGWIIIQS